MREHVKRVAVEWKQQKLEKTIFPNRGCSDCVTGINILVLVTPVLSILNMEEKQAPSEHETSFKGL